MPAIASRRTVCPACLSAHTDSAWRGGLSYRRCLDCKSLFDIDPPAPDVVESLYEGREYFVKDELEVKDACWGYPGDYLADRSMAEEKFGGILEHVERHTDVGRLLDVGCGPGFLLTAARARGWEPTGVDLNSWAARFAREELSLDVKEGDLASAGFADSSFDAVTLMDLIEHVPDPDDLISEVARIVRPEGALVILTPDAGSPVSRMLGRRWPEVRRPGEHTVLFSVTGLAALISRHGFSAAGVHSIGKRASISTLAADVSSGVPGLLAPSLRVIAESSVGRQVIEIDPHTKFCLYARKLPKPERRVTHRPAVLPRRASDLASVEGAIVDELASLGSATGFCNWMFDQFSAVVRGSVLEVGAGIGTYTQRILDAGADQVIAIEPEPSCADILEGHFESDDRVRVVREYLPDSPAIQAERGSLDLVVSQNVLEHIGDDVASLAAMARSLKPGGHLALVVPAGPSLYGPLDEAYGHWRRYTASELGSLVSEAGLIIRHLHAINGLGILGWRLKNLRPGARIGGGSLRSYEAMLPLWRRWEDQAGSTRGLSLSCLAQHPSE